MTDWKNAEGLAVTVGLVFDGGTRENYEETTIHVFPAYGEPPAHERALKSVRNSERGIWAQHLVIVGTRPITYKESGEPEAAAFLKRVKHACGRA